MKTVNYTFYVIILFGILISGSYAKQHVGNNDNILDYILITPKSNNKEVELGKILYYITYISA